jgi:hypothetical protein
MKSRTEPAARSPAPSSNTANPSDYTIDDKIAEPSRGYFIATTPLPAIEAGAQVLPASRLLAVGETSTYRK